jgi:hypothetical protein
MKKAEISTKVFEAMDALPPVDLDGGELKISIADLAGLSLVPWFCDPCVQWALRLSIPGGTLKKSALKKVNGSFVTENETGALLVGVPGDGIEPSMFVLLPLVEAIAQFAQPGMKLELAAANLGVVKRDWDAKAETDTTFGNQRYVGILDGSLHWMITQTTPGLTASALAVALGCGRLVACNGPWQVTDKSEAHAVLMNWLGSPEANVNPMAVKRFIALSDGAFTNSDPGMNRKLCGLGLGFFRHRLAGGPFRWPEPGPTMYSTEQLEEVARDVVG